MLVPRKQANHDFLSESFTILIANGVKERATSKQTLSYVLLLSPGDALPRESKQKVHPEKEICQDLFLQA